MKLTLERTLNTLMSRTERWLNGDSPVLHLKTSLAMSVFQKIMDQPKIKELVGDRKIDIDYSTFTVTVEKDTYFAPRDLPDCALKTLILSSHDPDKREQIRGSKALSEASGKALPDAPLIRLSRFWSPSYEKQVKEAIEKDGLLVYEALPVTEECKALCKSDKDKKRLVLYWVYLWHRIAFVRYANENNQNDDASIRGMYKSFFTSTGLHRFITVPSFEEKNAGDYDRLSYEALEHLPKVVKPNLYFSNICTNGAVLITYDKKELVELKKRNSLGVIGLDSLLLHFDTVDMITVNEDGSMFISKEMRKKYNIFMSGVTRLTKEDKVRALVKLTKGKEDKVDQMIAENSDLMHKSATMDKHGHDVRDFPFYWLIQCLNTDFGGLQRSFVQKCMKMTLGRSVTLESHLDSVQTLKKFGMSLLPNITPTSFHVDSFIRKPLSFEDLRKAWHNYDELRALCISRNLIPSGSLPDSIDTLKKAFLKVHPIFYKGGRFRFRIKDESKSRAELADFLLRFKILQQEIISRLNDSMLLALVKAYYGEK